MGNQASTSSLLNGTQFLKNIHLQTPISLHDPQHTEIHQIFSHSPEHHRLVLEKIRIKKNYECPFLIKIIDSHTLQSQNICSTVLKTYIVVEKPKSLTKQIEARIEDRSGFQEHQLWSIIFSCCEAIIFLQENNVRMSRVSVNKIFIDIKNNVKLLDPQFSQGLMPSQQNSQKDLIISISNVIRNIISIKSVSTYSDKILDLLAKMDHGGITLYQLRQYICEDYMQMQRSMITSRSQCKSHSQIFGVSLHKSNKYSKQLSRSKSLRKKSIKIYSNKRSSNNLLVSQSSSSQKSDTKTSQYGSSMKKQYILKQSSDLKIQVSPNNENKQNMNLNFVTSAERDRSKSKSELYMINDHFKNCNKIDMHMTDDSQKSSHFFPKKALFGQRKKSMNIQCLSSSVINNISQPEILSVSTKSNKSNLNKIRKYKTAHIQARKSQQAITDIHSQHSASVASSDIINMVTYYVDPETEVSEVVKQHQGLVYMKMNEQKENAEEEVQILSQQQKLQSKELECDVSMSQYKINVN